MTAERAAALQNNTTLNDLLEDFENITKEVIYDIATLLDVENAEGYITNTTIQNLYLDEQLMQRMSDKAGYGLYNPDGSVFVSPQKGIPARYLYIYMVYVYKFGSIEPYWNDHILDFLPRYDNAQISEHDQLRLLFEAIGLEFDKIEEQITKITQLGDINEIPDEYLAYLAQLLGYEKEDFQLGDVSFREIVKNALEIYKIKGTNYSFKFFFKFLGFDYEIIEKYFDRDHDEPGESPITAANYLTSVDPRKRFETDPNTGEVISAPINPVLFTETKNLEMFDWLADPASRGIDLDLLLGRVAGFPDPYTYFKTNFVQQELTQFYQGDTELMPSDPDIVDKIINKYIKFLSPSYIQSSININLTPYTDGPIPVYEDFTIELIKNIYDLIGVNSSGSEWEQLKSDYNTTGTEYDTQTIEAIDERLLRILNVTTEGAPLSDEEDRIGDYIRHNGVHARGKNNISHIIGLQHTLTFKTALESVIANVKHTNWDFSLTGDEFLEWLKTNPYPTHPIVPDVASLPTLSPEDDGYVYWVVAKNSFYEWSGTAWGQI